MALLYFHANALTPHVSFAMEASVQDIDSILPVGLNDHVEGASPLPDEVSGAADVAPLVAGILGTRTAATTSLAKPAQKKLSVVQSARAIAKRRDESAMVSLLNTLDEAALDNVVNARDNHKNNLLHCIVEFSDVPMLHQVLARTFPNFKLYNRDKRTAASLAHHLKEHEMQAILEDASKLSDNGNEACK